MKKILISIAILILLVLLYMTIVNSLEIGAFKIESIEGIKKANNDLNAKFSEAENGVTQKYPQQVKNLKDAITTLTDTKAQYESKIKYDENGKNITTVILKTYEVSFLYATVGNYAKANGLDLTFQLKPGISEGAYNIDFTVTGDYRDLTEFIYDVEDDSDLSFRIENFAIAPSGAVTTSSTTPAEGQPTGNSGTDVAGNETSPATTETQTPSSTNTTADTTTTSGGDSSKLQVTFTVTEVGIKFD